MRLAAAYRLAVLWLLSVCAQQVVETIYQHGHEAGAQELKEFMRKELLAVYEAQAKQAARDFSNGFAAGLRAAGSAPPREVDATAERVDALAWNVPPGRRPA